MVQLSNTITYPDGKPMADNTEQFRYIVTIQGNLDLHQALQRAESAEQCTAQEQQRADVAQAKLVRLAERMRELGLDPEA